MTTQPQRLDPASEAEFFKNTPIETVDSSGSPLRDFDATIAEVEAYLVTYRDQSVGTQVKLKFTDMVVHQSITPWPWAIGELNFNKNSDTVSPNSALGIFMDSITAIWGAGHILPELKTHKVRITFTPGHSVRRPPTDEAVEAAKNSVPPTTAQWRDINIDAFEVMTIDGASKQVEAVAGGNGPAPSPVAATTTPAANLDALLTIMANGKTQREFADAA